MRAARIGPQHGRLEHRGVAELGIAAAGGVRGRHRAPAAAAAEGAAHLRIGAAILLHQQAGEVHLAAGDVAVQVDAAGHDDIAVQVVFLIGGLVGRRDDAAIQYLDVARDRILAIGRVEHAPTLEPQSHATPPAIRRTASATLGSVATRKAPSGRLTMESMRNTVPAWSMPGVPTGMKTSGALSNTVSAWPMHDGLALERRRRLRPERRNPDQHVGILERRTCRIERRIMLGGAAADGGAQRIAEPPQHQLVQPDDVVAPAEREHPGAGGDVQRVDQGGGALGDEVAIVQLRRRSR